MYRNLRAEIARKGWTMGYIAEQLGKKPPFMSERINGKRNFTLPEAIRIKEMLGVNISIEELFER